MLKTYINKLMKFKFDNLDSIRTIAFFCTFLAHAFPSTNEAILNDRIYQYVTGFRELFSFGVPVFFVLSGFLITYLILKEQETPTSFNLRNFYIRRILRIWSVYYVVIFFGFFIFPYIRELLLNEPTVENASLINYILFLSNFDQITNNALPFGVGLGPTWSVSVEEQFYLVFPLLLLQFPKKKFIIPILAIMAASVICTPVFGLSDKHTLFCFTYLTMGGVFGYLSFYHTDFIRKIVSVHWIWFIVSAAAIVFLIQYGLFQPVYMLSIWLISLLIGYCIVFQCYSGKVPLKKIFALEVLGKYTYGLYLYHSICIFIVYAVAYKVLKFEENLTNVIFTIPVISLILSLIVSYLSYEYYEKRFLDLKEKFSKV